MKTERFGISLPISTKKELLAKLEIVDHLVGRVNKWYIQNLIRRDIRHHEKSLINNKNRYRSTRNANDTRIR